MRATAESDVQHSATPSTGRDHATAPSNAGGSPDARAAEPSGTQLLRTARGFSSIFWGIPILLLLMSGAITISLFSFVHMPAYVVGALAIYSGMMFLYCARIHDRRWRSILHRGLFGSLLLIYFSPFVFWWTNKPNDTYYFMNMLAFTLTALWTLFYINIIASETGRMLDDTLFRKEAHLCAWATATCAFVPLAFYIYLGTRISIEFECSMYEGFVEVTRDMSPWYLLVVILPFTLTMANAWQAKERCLRALRTRAD